MSQISEAIQAKCLAFSDRIIKLNDYLLDAASKKGKMECAKNDSQGKRLPSSI